MPNDRNKYTQPLIYTSIAVIITYVIISNLGHFYNLLSALMGALTPFVVGFTIAYILNPLVEKIIKLTQMKRGPAIACVYLGIIFLVSLFVNMVVPSIIEGTVQIANEIPGQVKQFDTEIKALSLDNPQINQ